MNNDGETILGTVVKTAKAKDQVSVGVLITSIGMGVFIASIDGTITNVSLPAIASSLGVEQYAVQWVILSYLL